MKVIHMDEREATRVRDAVAVCRGLLDKLEEAGFDVDKFSIGHFTTDNRSIIPVLVHGLRTLNAELGVTETQTYEVGAA